MAYSVSQNYPTKELLYKQMHRTSAYTKKHILKNNNWKTVQKYSSLEDLVHTTEQKGHHFQLQL